jgi:serine/threonine-protein kinase
MAKNDPSSCDWLVGEIVHSHLIERGDLEPIVTAFQKDNPAADSAALAEHLVRRGFLTTFQATRLLEGQGRGLVLGPYILVESIGSGSVGTVYKALGKADRRAYALKVLPSSSQWNVRQARKRLQTLPTEPHAAVVPILDVGTSAGLHYLVWPFIDGETLNQSVRREGLLPPARAGLIGLQLAQALQWCERHDTYHGAIKPSNVILCPEGQARLLDFGIGTLLTEGDDGALVDTLVQANSTSIMLDYTAPECLSDPAKFTVRGDQYSLGCTLYFGLTGRTPFPDGGAVEKMKAHQSQEPIAVALLNPGVPPVLAGVVERLMHKAPEARYNSVDELMTALMPVARLSAVYLPPARKTAPFLVPRPQSPASRHSGSLLAAVEPRTPTKPPSSNSLAPPRPAGRSSVLLPAVTDAANGAAAAPSPYPPVALATPSAAPSFPAAAPPKRSLLQRLGRAMAFWRTTADPVGCTVLTPSGMLPGETVTVQVVLHHAERSEQARTLPDWRGTQNIPNRVERGETVGLHLALQGVEVAKPTGQIVWAGLSAAALFSVRVPLDWVPGRPLPGVLTLGVRQQPVARLEFALPVAAPQKAQ